MRTAFILAHDDPAVLATYETFVPFWHEVADVVFLLTPEDRPLRPNPHGFRNRCPAGKRETVLRCGRSGYDGAASVARFKAQLRTVLAYADSFNMIFEYDSLVLPTPAAMDWLCRAESTPGIHAFAATWPGGDWATPTILHAPWMLDKQTLFKVAEAAESLPADFGNGMADQLWGEAVRISGVPVHNTDATFGGPTFTRNSIHGNTVPELLACIARGVFIVHGAKTNTDDRHFEALSHGPRS